MPDLLVLLLGGIGFLGAVALAAALRQPRGIGDPASNLEDFPKSTPGKDDDT